MYGEEQLLSKLKSTGGTGKTTSISMLWIMAWLGLVCYIFCGFESLRRWELRNVGTVRPYREREREREEGEGKKLSVGGRNLTRRLSRGTGLVISWERKLSL